ILSTIQSRMERFRTIAALSDSSPNEPISLRDFPNQEVILRFADDPEMAEDLQTLNQLFMKTLQDTLLSQWGGNPGETFVALDEFPRLGKLDKFADLPMTGRSFGVRMSLSVQEIDSFRRIYGDGANEIIGQFGNKALLRQEGPSSAQWSSSVVGQ